MRMKAAESLRPRPPVAGVRAGSGGPVEGRRSGGTVARWRTLLVLVLVMASLFFGSILFILSRAPR